MFHTGSAQHKKKEARKTAIKWNYTNLDTYAKDYSEGRARAGEKWQKHKYKYKKEGEDITQRLYKNSKEQCILKDIRPT